MYLRPKPTKSAQTQSKPLKVSQIFPDPSKNVAISTRIQPNLPNPTKINLNLSSKSIVSLSSHPKSTQIQSNLLKSARTTQTARIHKKLKQLQLNSPSQIQILPNLPEFTPIRQIVEIAYNLPTSIRRNRNPAEPLQINRIVLIQSSRDHQYLPKQTETQLSRQFRQIHKQLHIALNRQHLI